MLELEYRARTRARPLLALDAHAHYHVFLLHTCVAFRMALISSYFKPAQEALDPGTSQQGGEAHDSDNEVTRERVESEGSDVDDSFMGSEAGLQPTASKRVRIHHYDSEWQRKYDWLSPVRGSTGAVVGMLCNLCKKHKTIARNGSSKWSIEPCTCLRVDAVTRHAKSSQHKTSVSKELVLQQSCGGESIAYTLLLRNKLAEIERLLWVQCVLSTVSLSVHFSLYIKCACVCACTVHYYMVYNIRSTQR